jgi:hypothetical protein
MINCWCCRSCPMLSAISLLLMAASGCFWLPLAAPGCPWPMLLLLLPLSCPCLILATPSCSSLPLKQAKCAIHSLTPQVPPYAFRRKIAVEARPIWHETLSWALLDSPRLSWAPLGSPKLSSALLGSPGLSWAVMGSPGLSSACLGCPGFS